MLKFTSFYMCADHDEVSAAFDAGHVSLVGQEAVWMLLSYKPTEVQEPPEACYSQLMHSPNLPLRFSSLCHALPLSLSLPLFPKLCFFHELLLSSKHPPPLSSANHSPSPRCFPPACSVTRAHALTHIHRNCGSYHNSMQPPPHSSEAVYKCLWLALTHILI